MLYLPTFRQLSTPTERLHYSAKYEACSGLPVPPEYLLSDETQVFGVYYRKALIGGFMLGFGREFRTVQLFSRPEARPSIREAMDDATEYTELCCLWLARKYRTTFLLNTFTWMMILYALLRFANQRLLFGTRSKGLARLYASSKRTQLLHKDIVQRKQTYIFTGRKCDYFTGILNILRHKCCRNLRLAQWSLWLKRA